MIVVVPTIVLFSFAAVSQIMLLVRQEKKRWQVLRSNTATSQPRRYYEQKCESLLPFGEKVRMRGKVKRKKARLN